MYWALGFLAKKNSKQFLNEHILIIFRRTKWHVGFPRNKRNIREKTMGLYTCHNMIGTLN
jgi:hypothetical protein